MEGSVLGSGTKLQINARLVQVADEVPLWAERFDRDVKSSSDVFAILDEISRAVANKLGWAPRSAARGGSMGSGAEGAGDPQWGSPYAVDVNAGWRLGLTGLRCKQRSEEHTSELQSR